MCKEQNKQITPDAQCYLSVRRQGRITKGEDIQSPEGDNLSTHPGRNGQRDSVAQQKQREKRARCRRNKNLRKAEEKSSANLTAGLKGLNVQVVVRDNVVATP